MKNKQTLSKYSLNSGLTHPLVCNYYQSFINQNLIQIMKKISLFLAIVLCFSLTSCFTNTFSVGKGAQGSVTVKKKNHYLINGLAVISTADPKQMAGDTEDYEVTITHSFVDGLLAAITFGIYTPTTTIVKK